MRTTAALAVGTVPFIRAVTQLLCRQEIDIETWAGRPLKLLACGHGQFTVGREGAHCSAAI